MAGKVRTGDDGGIPEGRCLDWNRRRGEAGSERAVKEQHGKVGRSMDHRGFAG